MIGEIELDLLGAAMFNPRLTAAVALTGGEFESPVRGAVWEAIRSIHAAGHAPTPPLIVEEAKTAQVRVDHAAVVDLVGRGMAINAEVYAQRISDAATRRDVFSALTTAAQQIKTDLPTDRVVADLIGRIGATTQAEQDSAHMLTLDEFVEQDLPPQEWVVPGLFAKGDRAIITGTEGLGKSTLIRQIAVCAAAGLHPFAFSNAAPRRVLVVDVENPKPIMVKRFSELRTAMRNRGLSTGDRMWIERRPQGLDLSETRDRLLLHNLCMLANPDLMVIGPAYKLYVGGSNSREEDLARQVTSTLDALREEFGFALILEHHSPHGTPGQRRDIRPIGSSLWRRWPEFGFGLALADGSTLRDRSVDVVHWRGGRDDRPWPKQLMSATVLPWADANPDDTYRNWTPSSALERNPA